MRLAGRALAGAISMLLERMRIVGKYDALLDALDEYRDARDESLPDYDPCGYARSSREERRILASAKLDDAFATIINHLAPGK